MKLTDTSKEKLETKLFGKQVEFEYSKQAIGYSILSLRAIMAWIFLQAGIDKILYSSWNSTDFLENAVADANPFYELFQWFAMHPELVDPMVMYSQVIIGLALLLGVFFRLAALAGGLQMLLFWMASIEAGIAQGLPVEHGYIVNETLVYIFLLYGLGALGAGRVLGLDKKIENTDTVEKYPQIRYILG